MKFSSRKQGDCGLGAAIGYFTSIGYTVCVPLTDNQDYDLVVEFPDGLKKIECKTTSTQSHNNYVVSLRTLGGNQSWGGKIKTVKDTSADYLFILSGNGKMYLLPTEEVTCSNLLSLNSDRDKYIITFGTI